MTRFFSTRFLVMAVFALALAAGNAFAQASGSITGVVTDSNGAVVPNATVKLVNADKAVDKTVQANDAGIYSFTSLAPGTYKVSASGGNFAAQTVDVEVQVGRVTNNNFTLGVSGVSANVEVTAEGVQVTQSNNDAVVNETAIQNLPINGRRFQDFVTLTPTAQVDPSRGQISLSGQKGINGNVNVDGVDYNQPFFGGIRGGERSNLAFTIPQESIKEFQVVANGYNAEYGRSTGGVVNAITKSGDNEFRGSAFGLWRPAKMARGNQFTDALVAQKLAPAGLNPTLAPTQYQWGGSAGGRIVKDKLFFFGSYEGQRFRAPRTVLFSFPTIPAGLSAGQQAVLSFYQGLQVPFTTGNDAWAGLARADWNITESHRFNVRYNQSSNNAPNAAGTGGSEASVDPSVRGALSANGTEQDRTKGTVAQLISTFGANYINEARFQWAKEARPRLANATFPQVSTGVGVIGAGAISSSFLPNEEHDRRYQVADSFTIAKGSHSFKFGGEYSDIFAAQNFGFNRFGQYSYTAAASTSCATAATCTMLTTLSTDRSGNFLGRFDQTNAFYNLNIGNFLTSLTVKELAMFAQDSWRISPKVTINYGLRVENQYNPPGDATNTTIANVVKTTVFPFLGKGVDPAVLPDSGWEWGPRGGIAYDPKGDGKTVFRAFAGKYFARTTLIWLAPGTENYRSTPANVTSSLFSSLTTANQNAFYGFVTSPAGAQYKAITGCVPAALITDPVPAACVPNTPYRQFAMVGIDLNTFALNNLPTLTQAQLGTIAGAFGLPATSFTGASPISFASDYKNPSSLQWGGAFERQIARGLVFGVDYADVKTSHVGRYVDLNEPTPMTAQAYVNAIIAQNGGAADNRNIAMTNNGLFAALLSANRTYYNVATPAGFVNCSASVTVQCLAQNGFGGATANASLPAVVARPTSALRGVGLHMSNGNSHYRALTTRLRWVSKRMQLNAYYTLSRNMSDDDNERQEGVGYTDLFNLNAEYNRSRMNRTHMFMANPIVFLPWDFEVSGTVRFRSGLPFNATVNADLNGDGVNNDRPALPTGGIMPRNYYTNKGIYEADARVQKTFKFGERSRIVLTTDFFNVMNRPNLVVGTTQAPSTATSFGAGGNYCVAATQTCGLANGTPKNPNFLQLYDTSTGILALSNINPSSSVFQMQFGARFNW